MLEPLSPDDLATLLAAIEQVFPVEAAFRASVNNDPAQRGATHDRINALCASSWNSTGTAASSAPP